MIFNTYHLLCNEVESNFTGNTYDVISGNIASTSLIANSKEEAIAEESSGESSFF